jgi:SAM-dependent methyltransferase
MKVLRQLAAGYRRSTTWTKIVLFAMLIGLVLTWGRQQAMVRSGFTSAAFASKTGPDVYDDFYAQIYDQLVYNNLKNEFEIGQIVNSTHPTEKSLILDIGSGTGHHVAAWKERNYHAVGIDISEHVVTKAKSNYPNYDFSVKDAMNGSAFGADSFTLITCMYFTIYYFQDKRQFFSNCFTWLKPGGYLVVHLVNRSQFDPILPPGNPMLLVSPQKYAPKRITSTTVNFDQFAYTADFDLDAERDKAVFKERFKNPDGETFRRNEHVFYMERQSVILQLAFAAGFSLVKKIDMASAHYDSQYLYVLVKD